MNSDPTPELKGFLVASELVPAVNIVGDDEQDTVLLRKMSEDAKHYISSFPWCETILNSYFGGGVGGIFAVFFFHIRAGHSNVDPWIWVVVGDIPSACLPVTDCESPAGVFRSYVRGMSRWVELARMGQTGPPEQGVPPVNVSATPEWAERLNRKLDGLTVAVRPFFEDEEGSQAN